MATLNATEHVAAFVKPSCDHPCCRHNLIQSDETRAFDMLSENTNWWSCVFVGAFASLTAHVEGHRENVTVVFRLSNSLTWDGIEKQQTKQKRY